ncbi:SusC/RagA family TonB-linked outer membrane protein [Pontibacter sp. CAU 1760]
MKKAFYPLRKLLVPCLLMGSCQISIGQGAPFTGTYASGFPQRAMSASNAAPPAKSFSSVFDAPLQASNQMPAKARQNAPVNGRVVDEKGTGLPGVTVLVKGTTTGVSTDASGNFSISAPAGATLVFSYIGFQRQEVAVNNRSTVNVTMGTDTKALQEVVVTGYSSQAKKDITGAVAMVSAEELLSVPATNVAQALQGRAAGVTVGNDNSPGGGVMVRVRGFGTINDNSPLYVIDGVPTKGNLNTLNPNDIESMQILKDASSASIYGARAGNGVVIITTKKGKSGEPRITFDSYYGVQRHGKLLDLLNTNELAELTWESERNAGKLLNGNPSNPQYGNGPTPVIPDFIYPTGAKADDPRVNQANYTNDIDDPAFGKTKFQITRANKDGTNWLEEIFRPAVIQNYQVGATGGTDKGVYAFSANYYDQEGILKDTYYKRYAVRANTEFKIKNRARVGENLQVSFGERVGQVAGNNSESNPISMAYRMQPIIPVYDIMGNFAGTKGGGLGNARNPVALQARNKDNVGQEVRLFGNIFAELDLMKNLTARTSFGLDYNSFNMRNFSIRDVESAEAAQTNSLSTNNSYDRDWTWSNTLAYDLNLSEVHRINVLLGTEAISSYGENFFGSRSGFFVDDLDFRYLSAGSLAPANGGGGYDWRLFSTFGKVNYSFMDKYLLEGTVRRDASSRFAPANRYATFPAMSAGWRITQEEFMKGISFLDELKLRAGWGQTGNQEIGNYNFASTFQSHPDQSNYDINGTNTTVVIGYDRSQFGNPNAKWETTTSTNIGFDAALFQGRVDFVFDWYTRTTTDMLFPVELPFTQGVATNPFVNIGEMNNKGVDLGLNYNGTALGNELTFTVGANLSTYRNMVVKTNGNPNTIYQGFGLRTPPVTATQQGQPLSSFYGYIVDGIFMTDDEAKAHAVQRGGADNIAGRFKYRDVNGDGVINGSDQTFIGNPHPDFTYGLNLNAEYKNFTLTVFAQGVQGADVFNYVRYWTDFQTFQGNRSKRMLYDSWRPGKTDALLPQLRSGDAASSVPSTYFIEDGSYLRVKNIQLGYNLPTSWISRAGMGRANIYIQGQNLFTFTKYTGLDPEINLRGYGAGNDRQLGVDEGAYPVSKNLLVGVNVSF